MNIENIISQMTLEEKTAIMMGRNTWQNFDVKRLDIPAIFLSDGPNGLRKQAGAGDHLGLNASVPATCFPTASAVANSWNEQLGEEIGKALGEEAACENVNVLLGPGLNIKRSPLCGRNFEYFSEDPLLAGKMAAAYIRGIQSEGIAACPKHFAVNSQECKRMASDSVVDERTLRELYLKGFEIAVKESNPKSIMSSYNMVNGTYANENKHLLTDILRNEWGFEGFVVSDWGGSNDRTAGTIAGANLEMPAPGADSALGLIKAVEEGLISEETINDRVREILPVILDISKINSNEKKEYDKEAHHLLAGKASEEGIVLLENDGLLPLGEEIRVALIGDFANKPRYQGAGSSMVNPTKIDNLVTCFEKNNRGYIGNAIGYVRTGEREIVGMVEGAVDLARAADVVIFCMGLDEVSESEGMDRRNMDLPVKQVELLKKVSEVNKNVILVLSGGAPFVMPDKKLYRAAVHGYLAGQAGAGALYKVITGEINPSGKLSETWPLKLEDTSTYPGFPGNEKHILYKEAMYVGYRYFEKNKLPVRYPFGYGLSYTSFEYSNAIYENGCLCLDIENTGKVDGKEVVQVYLGHKGKIFGPEKTLAGFAKVFVKAHSRERVSISIPKDAFCFYNVKSKKWEIEGGSYTLYVGASSADIRLTLNTELVSTLSEYPYEQLPNYEKGCVKGISDEEFEKILGRPVPKKEESRELDINDALCEMKHARSGVARLAGRIIEKKKLKSDSATIPDLNILFVYNMPFRAIAKMAGGMVSMKMVEDMMILVNGRFFKGLGKLIADFIRNKKASKEYMKKLEGN